MNKALKKTAFVGAIALTTVVGACLLGAWHGQQQQQPVKYKAELTLQEWQVVFTGLLELPGKVGNPVINQLQVQLQAQDSKGTAAPVVPPADKKKDTTTTKSQTTKKP